MDLQAFLVALDEHIRSFPGEPAPAELFAVRAEPAGLAVCFLWSGVANELPESLVPPSGCVGIVLATTGWVAPMDGVRPSAHRDRQRVRMVTLVCGHGAECTLILAQGESAELLSGAVGTVPELLRRCWSRRPDALAYTLDTPDV